MTGAFGLYRTSSSMSSRTRYRGTQRRNESRGRFVDAGYTGCAGVTLLLQRWPVTVYGVAPDADSIPRCCPYSRAETPIRRSRAVRVHERNQRG
jgi:hypothetical protein